MLNTNDAVGEDSQFTISNIHGISGNQSSFEEKRKKAVEYLGKKWILHPSNKVAKKEGLYSVLGKV